MIQFKLFFLFLQYCRPQLFVYDDLLKNDNETNLEHAFRIALDHLNIDRLLEPEGMKEGVISLDTRCIRAGFKTYVTSLAT